MLLVGHDAFSSGAQQLLLNIGKTLRSAFGVEIEFLLLAGGRLEAEYAAVAPLSVLGNGRSLAARCDELLQRGFTAAIVNTTAAGEAAAILADRGLHTVLLVHEMPRLLREKKLEDKARAGISRADHVVFPAALVRDKVIGALGVSASENFVVRPQGMYKRIEAQPDARSALRQELGIATTASLVIGVGYADMRKGFDLFLQLWRLTKLSRSQVHFAWIGGIDPELAQWLSLEIEEAKASGSFHMAGYRNDVNAFFSAADAFALTSREDPFPTVVLEAMAAELPVVAFEGTGGIPELLKERALGYVVPFCDVPGMAAKLNGILGQTIHDGVRARAREACEKQFAFTPYVRDVLRMALPGLPTVSVVVPTFNYARYLPARLGSIFDQTQPIQEIIVLDDASTDDSIAVIEERAEERERDITLVINEANSGSVFAQWARGAQMATGEFVWIAEADDLSEPTFLSHLVALMRSDPSIGLGFCDFRSIDAKDVPVYSSYKPYFATLEPNALTRSEVFDGREFMARFLSVKNTILNVSSVVWRREALLRALATCGRSLTDFRMAGDWRLYVECLSLPNAKIAYEADALNVHRRHAQSVTHTLNAQKHVEEIAAVHTMIQERIECSKTVSAAQSAYRGEVLAQLQGGKLIAPKPEADKPAALAAGTERSRQKQKPKLKSNRKAKIVRGSAQSKKAPDLALSTRSRRAHYA